jgi:hypothetical protein
MPDCVKKPFEPCQPASSSKMLLKRHNQKLKKAKYLEHSFASFLSHDAMIFLIILDVKCCMQEHRETRISLMMCKASSKKSSEKSF